MRSLYIFVLNRTLKKKIKAILVASCLIFFIHTEAQIIQTNIIAIPNASSKAEPAGTCPLYIKDFYPTSASTGDTVTIQLLLPCEVDSVWFGGVLATAIGGTPQFTALVKAVVGAGNSGIITIKNQWGASSKNGFIFLPLTVLPKPVKLCPPVAGATLNAELISNSYKWQESIDSSNFTDISIAEHYDSVTSAKLILRNIPSSWNKRRYRCVTPTNTSRVFILLFQNEFLQTFSSSWENPLNWGCNVEPDEYTDVVLTQGVVVLSSDVTIKSLTLIEGANFTIKAGSILTIKK